MIRIPLALAALIGCSPQATEPAARPPAPPAVTAAPSPRPVPHHASRSRRLDVTCYVATGDLTASGKRPRVGMAAGNRWPFGTVLRVQGVGTVRVEDRIGHSSQLDLFYASKSACKRFGRHQLTVEVVK